MEEMLPEEGIILEIILGEVIPQEVITQEVFHEGLSYGGGGGIYQTSHWVEVILIDVGNRNDCKLIKSSRSMPRLVVLLERIHILDDFTSISPSMS